MIRKAVNDNHCNRSIKLSESKEKLTGPNRKCPMCGKQTVQEYRPFCSRRCADLDLGKWLGGNYAIPGNVETEEDGALPTQDQDFEKNSREND